MKSSKKKINKVVLDYILSLYLITTTTTNTATTTTTTTTTTTATTTRNTIKPEVAPSFEMLVRIYNLHGVTHQTT